jgi:hypothetical protein
MNLDRNISLKRLLLSTCIVPALICLYCCNNRSSLTPEKALLGHWRNELGNTHHYFKSDSFIMVDNGKTSEPLPYSVLEIKDAASRIKIDVKGRSLPGIFRHMTATFSSDRKSLLREDNFTGFNIPPERWYYVDSKDYP